MTAEPGMPGNPIELTDPEMMRALAHQGLSLALIPRGAGGGGRGADAAAEIAVGASPSGVLIAANLANGGMDGVALPALAHARFGAAGYGALLACFAAGALAGTLAAARTGSLRAPAMLASAVFLVEAITISLTPYLGGEAGAAAALFASGACNGLGNVIFS